ncbi:MAG: zinc-binding dehydrogenase [Candidatus Latescibacterota bacterium]|nr:zinc-binding dehydrogenase [Candidatus Latescibacterota bacterium]
MKRVAKPEGAFNIVLEEVNRPAVTPTEVQIRAECSLISRGSEIWRRYVREEAIDHRMMGYSLVGRISDMGSEVEGFQVGDRVAALAPHAEYVTVEVVNPSHHPTVVILPDSVSTEAGTFWPLCTSSVLWMWQTESGPNDNMVIQGQGLVGSGCMLAARAQGVGRIIGIDTLPLRCELARELGIDEIIDASSADPVQSVQELTDGEGADVVVEAVGGRAGAEAFAQAQDMLKRGGLLQVLGLYEDEPLPLYSGKIMGKRIVGSYVDGSLRPQGSDHALELMATGQIPFDRMITHRFSYTDAAEAFDLLYHQLGETMAVLLTWEEQ